MGEMIEPADRQTQPLPLDEQPAKPRRGRPATGKALSNAERQRLYRERQKAQRNEKSDKHPVPYEEVVAIAQELAERCKRAEDRQDELHDQVQKMLLQRDELIRECRKLKKELASSKTVAKTKRHRDETPNVMKQYHAQNWDAKARKWRTIGDSEPDNQPFDDWKEAEEFIKRLLNNGSKSRYRIVPANLTIIEYK
jgi:Mg2+ and Co2+ transporter CorA